MPDLPDVTLLELVQGDPQAATDLIMALRRHLMAAPPADLIPLRVAYTTFHTSVWATFSTAHHGHPLAGD